MPTRNFTLAPGEFYHLYNRGTDKRKIFNNKKDYARFLALLYLCNRTTPADLKFQGRNLEEIVQKEAGKDPDKLIDICAFCLMPNHFHLLVREKTDNGISKFMQKLTTGYTMYFNKQYERTGGLFQGSFKSTHADNDPYLSYLISYIHLNPVKLIDPKWKESGIKDRGRAENFLRDYQFSSYKDYLEGGRVEEKIINKTALPEYFQTPKEFQNIVTEWLSSKPKFYKV